MVELHLVCFCRSCNHRDRYCRSKTTRKLLVLRFGETNYLQVIGTAIALNILLKVPLVAGCAISIVDVLVILFFYNPTGMSMRALRTFEFFVILLVLGVVICFCYQLSKIQNT